MRFLLCCRRGHVPPAHWVPGKRESQIQRAFVPIPIRSSIPILLSVTHFASSRVGLLLSFGLLLSYTPVIASTYCCDRMGDIRCGPLCALVWPLPGCGRVLPCFGMTWLMWWLWRQVLDAHNAVEHELVIDRRSFTIKRGKDVVIKEPYSGEVQAEIVVNDVSIVLIHISQGRRMDLDCINSRSARLPHHPRHARGGLLARPAAASACWAAWPPTPCDPAGLCRSSDSRLTLLSRSCAALGILLS